ncbi:uncharacterized protein LOC143083363 isoform X1 [Mytilus galloprovincialis]|uniref:uncharacterized protein LOC143083363 isoform X1 n=2 Tax=Mytilus galloprovincialis TaxID=29158 RepID=UPI003F7B5D88
MTRSGSRTKFEKLKTKPKMYNTNIVMGSQKENEEKKKAKCDVLAVYMPDEDIQSQLMTKKKTSQECIDYRSYLPVYQPTTIPFRNDLKKHKHRKILLGILFASIIVLFMALGGTIGYGVYKGMF